MQIKYRILKTDPSTHSLTVRFYTDLLSEEYLTAWKNADGTPANAPDGTFRCRTDFPITIWQVPMPTGQALEDYILAHVPIEWLQLHHDILNTNIDTSLSDILSLIGKETTVTYTPPTQSVKPTI